MGNKKGQKYYESEVRSVACNNMGRVQNPERKKIQYNLRALHLEREVAHVSEEAPKRVQQRNVVEANNKCEIIKIIYIKYIMYCEAESLQECGTEE